MDGSPEVIELLNAQLTAELTAINQYFLHAKMQAHWGCTRLAAWTRKESIEEMWHADELTDRILMLGGLPNYQRLLPLLLRPVRPAPRTGKREEAGDAGSSDDLNADTARYPDPGGDLRQGVFRPAG